MCCIDIKELSLYYGKHAALRNLTLSVHENQIIGLIGKNGSGKSTFLKLCSGLLRPSRGSIKVFHEAPMDNLPVLKEIIYSRPDIKHKGSNTLGRIIEYYAMLYENFDKNFAWKLLDAFSLHTTDKYKNLSTGMTSLFNFICAISTRAKLTLLDEPVVGMDVTVRKKVYEILLRDYMEFPRTFIISSHIMSELEEILSEMLLLDCGTLLLYKSMEEAAMTAYRVDGTRENVTAFIEGKNTLYIKHNITGSYAVVENSCDDVTLEEGRSINLSFSKVSAENLYIYKTNHGKEMEFSCLWEKQNGVM